MKLKFELHQIHCSTSTGEKRWYIITKRGFHKLYGPWITSMRITKYSSILRKL
jgi:hypothetical protein